MFDDRARPLTIITEIQPQITRICDPRLKTHIVDNVSGALIESRC